MSEHVLMDQVQGGSDLTHHSSRGAEIAVGPLADVVNQRSTFIVRRRKKTLGTYLGNLVRRGDLPGILLTKIIKHVMGSVGELEIAALFYNCKAAIPLRMVLQEMGHQQRNTPAITENSSAEGLINKQWYHNKPKTMTSHSTG